jgi:hypothetical protein
MEGAMRIAPFVVAGLGLVACRGSSGGNNPDSPGGGDGSSGVTIQDVQNDAMAVGTPVALHGVIVTAIDAFGAKTGNLWVEEPGGGPRSGVLVYKADTTVVATLQPGDIVDITGAQKAEFALTSDTSGRTDTELEPAAMGGTVGVTKTGTGTVPGPDVVDALAIGQMADPARSMEWEKWEGVLITVNNVSALAAPKSFGSTMPPPADNWAFSITGVAKVEGSLADITASGIARNTCLASVTGVADYFFDYLLLPRSTAEMMTGGSSCPAAENSHPLCSDGMDNDGNGYGDCMDDNCMVADNVCRTGTTISSLDMAVDANSTMPTLPTGGLELGATETVCVTAVTSNGQNMWVAKGPGAASADNGIYVYGGGQALPTGVAAGSKVSVIGQASAYKPTNAMKPLLEFGALQTTKVTGTCTVTPATQTAALLAVEATGRPWVGSLVTVSGKNKITVAETSANKYTGQLTNAGVTFNVLGDILQDADAVGTCYGTVTGIWTWDPYNNVFAIELTAMPATSTGCP